MFTLKYRNQMGVAEVSFDSYMKLLFFVASNKIKDEDFVSIDLGDGVEIEGIDNLYSSVATMAQEAIEAQNAKSKSEEEDETDDYEENGDSNFEIDQAIRELENIYRI